MGAVFKGLWLGLRFVGRGLVSLGEVIIGLITVLAAVAQILAFWFEYQNIVIASLRNLLIPIQVAAPTALTPRAAAQCLRYEQRPVDPQCERLADPRQRLLCRITLPPVEQVCVEEADGASDQQPAPVQP